MKSALLLSLLSVVLVATCLAADPAPVVGKSAIVDGLKKKPLTRSIGVAAKPQITTNAILFKFGTTDFEGDNAFSQIKELGKALEDPTLKDATLEIQGHTDNVGSDEYNKKLSEERARKIVEELQRHYNLSVKQLIPVGKGKDEPVAGSKDQQSDTDRAQNRRVVVKRLDQ